MFGYQFLITMEKSVHSLHYLVSQFEQHFTTLHSLLKKDVIHSIEENLAGLELLQKPLLKWLDEYRTSKARLLALTQKTDAKKIENLYKMSTQLQAQFKIHYENTRIDLYHRLIKINDQLQFTWKATLPYEPPIYTPSKECMKSC